MEKKIIYLKTLQFVLTLTIIWQLRSLHQFCGTFANPKAFLHDISIGHCKNFTLIGKDSKSGEFGAVFDQDKWHNQLSMSSTNGRPIKEQQHQFMDELAAKLPSAERNCIPITISPFDWLFDFIGMDTNLLINDILLHFSAQLFNALLSLVPLGIGTVIMLCFVDSYKFFIYAFAFTSGSCWCVSALCSSNLLLYWPNFWVCANFRADQINVPLVIVVISIVLACSSVFEIFFMNLLLKKRPVNAPTTADAHHHKLRNDVATECAFV